MDMDPKHMKTAGIVLLAIGVLFLLQDLGIWAFWGISWYTVVFLMVGCHKLMGCCKPKKK